MAKIRFFQRGWSGSRPARSIEEVMCGVDLLGVEIDGCMIRDVAAASIEAARPGIAVPVLMLHLIGPVEIVYVGEDGEPLGRGDLDPATAAPGAVHEQRFEAGAHIASAWAEPLTDMDGRRIIPGSDDLIADRLNAEDR